MNAKELREAAQRLIDNVRLWEADKLDLDLIEAADYILAKVRDDDDEYADQVWQSLVTFDAAIGDGKWIVAKMFDTWDDIPKSRSNKTRGQFRSLCRGLGIELKEGGQ